MTALEPLDRDFLDFLCAAAHHRCHVRAVKAPRRASLRRLRFAGLVGMDTFLPSGSAMSDWMVRNIPPSPPQAATAAGEEQPTPKAAEAEGGAVARQVSAPPMRKVAADDAAPPRPTGEQIYRLLMIEGERRGLSQSAVSMEAFGNVCQMSMMKSGQRPVQRRTLEKAHAWLDLAPNAPTRPFVPEQVRAQRQIAKGRRENSERARKRIAQGLPASGAKSASVRHAQFAIERENEIAARLADPIEQAKQALRKRYTPVLNAETMGGPKGHFIVGRKTVTREELLGMAGRAA